MTPLRRTAILDQRAILQRSYVLHQNDVSVLVLSRLPARERTEDRVFSGHLLDRWLVLRPIPLGCLLVSPGPGLLGYEHPGEVPGSVHRGLLECRGHSGNRLHHSCLAHASDLEA